MAAALAQMAIAESSFRRAALKSEWGNKVRAPAKALSMDGKGKWAEAFKASRALLVWAFIFGAGVNILYLAPSLFMMQVYDRVLQTGGLGTLWFVGAILIFALAMLAFLDVTRNRLMARMSLRLDRLLAPALLQAAQQREPQQEGARRQVMRVFDSFRQALTGPAAGAVMDAPWAPIYVAVCFLIHPVIGMVTLAGSGILVLLAMRNERALRSAIAQASEMAPRLYAEQEADDAFAEAARALGMRKVLIERHLQSRADINQLQARSLFGASTYAGLTRFVRLALQSTALGVGAWLAVEGKISPGALIAGSILTSRALAPLEQIVGAWRQIGEARNAARAAQQALEDRESVQSRTALPAPRGDLRLERVSARASGTERAALLDLTLGIAPGEILGVIGPSGAGKSTLARIASGASPPDAGIVRLDGANIADWDSDALGAHIGYVPQEIALLGGTIAENIRRFENRDTANAAEIDAETVEAARCAGAHEMILRLPGGYDTVLGRSGRGLSLGQSQRIALARALYRAPSLLVLDEPNAHLDQEGEAAVIEALRAAKARGAAILVIAHRAGVLAVADRLAVLREGRLDAVGPRDEITARLAQAAQQAGVAQLRPRDQPTLEARS